ncbi:MAG: imidazole glycerol phosphate synthase subunit HisH [Sedimentisphaerales bacterium]|nr:imidazole glycerol phosphate synthase subunit HisH [Sedimentisphaerales bacterium]
MIKIIDYGMGNVKSVANMLRKAGHDFQIVSDPLTIKKAEKIILPGVGAFDAGMKLLKSSGIYDVLNRCVLVDKIPILGICLGMQLLARMSEEGKEVGLSWIDADVKRFDFSQSDQSLKVPHMGWNYVLSQNENSNLFATIHQPMRFYFVHSYHFVCNDHEDVLATAHYGYDFTCAVCKENIYGVQFHPEKSHKYGLQLLKNFLELC